MGHDVTGRSGPGSRPSGDMRSVEGIGTDWGSSKSRSDAFRLPRPFDAETVEAEEDVEAFEEAGRFEDVEDLEAEALEAGVLRGARPLEADEVEGGDIEACSAARVFFASSSICGAFLRNGFVERGAFLRSCLSLSNSEVIMTAGPRLTMAFAFSFRFGVVSRGSSGVVRARLRV